jgi:nucleoside-diphosphate-sugar epimerase
LETDSESAKILKGLPGASERLELFAADILKPGSFDSVFEGCDGIFHTAAATPSLTGVAMANPDVSDSVSILVTLILEKELKV